MTDAVFVLMAKLAALAVSGGFALNWGVTRITAQAEAAEGWLVTGGGLTAIVVLVYKLLTDHTTVTRERASMAAQNAACEAKLEASMAREELWQQRCHEVEIAAARLGLELPPVPHTWTRDGESDHGHPPP